jgi:hypothetical protein
MGSRQARERWFHLIRAPGTDAAVLMRADLTACTASAIRLWGLGHRGEQTFLTRAQARAKFMLI